MDLHSPKYSKELIIIVRRRRRLLPTLFIKAQGRLVVVVVVFQYAFSIRNCTRRCVCMRVAQYSFADGEGVEREKRKREKDESGGRVTN